MLTATFDAPFYTGGPGLSDVGTKWDVALNRRGYMIDWYSSPYTGHSEFLHASVPLLRQQADSGRSPSEASVNPADLWRRSQDTWHDGAGQSYYDRADSDPARFDTSKGVDVWTKWQLGLLPDTTQKRSSSNTNLLLTTAALVLAGEAPPDNLLTYLYVADGSTLLSTTDLSGTPTWATITGSPASITGMCSDGFNVFTAHDSSGIYRTQAGAGTTVTYATGNVSIVGYVKGRLMAAYRNLLYNVTTSGALPAALLTHPNAGFTWVGFADGPSVIYAAGYAGDKSYIYSTAVKADGTALSVPVIAGQLPDGEIIRSIVGYLGFILVGSDKGVRFATPDSSGNLTFGSLIPIPAPVQAFEAQDRFVWFGWSNYDGTSTGLGRLDLSTFTATSTPAYASDLMVTGQGAVVSATTFQDLRVFGVSGLGVYRQSATNIVASGTLTTGQITYELPDDKVAMFVDVRHDDTGQHSVELSTNGGPFVLLGTHTTQSDPFEAGQARGTRFNIRLTLTSVSGVTAGLRSLTLRSYPSAAGIDEITAPIMLAEAEDTRNVNNVPVDPMFELTAIKTLKETRALVSWQEPDQTYQVVVEDYEWRPTHSTQNRTGFNGTCVVHLKVVV